MSIILNVPQLRFSEFSGEWEEKRLELVAEKIQDGTHFSPNISENGLYKYITSKNIRNGYMDFTLLDYISEEEHNKIYKRCSVKYGDILLTKDGASTGNVCLNTLTEEFSLLSSVAFIRVNNTYATNNFIFQYITSARGQYLIRSSMAGQAITRITLTKLKEFKFFYPSKQEQEKIASFLSSVDTKVEQLTSKAKLLQEYKKGVMQKIFSQEIRFRDDDGSKYPEWVERKLGEVGKTFNGLTGKTKEDFGTGKPYIQYKQIFDNSKININNFGYVNIRDKEKQNSAQYGDVFFTTSSETPMEVGFASVLLDEFEELYLNSFCFGYRANSLTILNPKYSQYLFRSAKFRKEVVKLAQGSTRYNMSKVELMKIKIQLPSSEEQTKIASFLSSIDSKIEQIQKQLDSTKEFKKALLQQMFV